MSRNISKEKREILVDKINKIKQYISQFPQDENTFTLLSYIADIEKDIKGKKYGLVFEEHKETIDEILENNVPILTEEKDLFINNGGQMNFLIEGDNLASLKLLEKTHKGKMDLIYIDPPYNTGNKDFVYDDNIIDINDTYRHSKWLSFINSRLLVANKLMNNESLIFISIDENEYANIKLLCDKIFGENNYITTFDWMKTATPPSLSKNVRRKYEYVLCYKKGKIKQCLCGGIVVGGDMPLLNDGNKIINAEFQKENIITTISDGIYKKGKYDRVELLENFIVEKNKAITNLKIKGPLKWTQETINQETKNGTTFYIKSDKFAIRYARIGERIKIPSNIISKDECNVGTNEDGAKEIKYLFGDKVFDYPKPTSLIKYLINMLSYYKKNITILDFFAGSGTTGHAVMKLNAEDGGNRKFILCTNNENNICRDVTYERIKRVIEKDKYEASLKYMKVDFVPISDKLYYEYADELLKHIKELVELENGINFTSNKELAIILSEQELDEFTNNIPNECKTIYLGHDVLPTEKQEILFKEHKITINIIPDYYYRDLEG